MYTVVLDDLHVPEGFEVIGIGSFDLIKAVAPQENIVVFHVHVSDEFTQVFLRFYGEIIGVQYVYL